MSKTFIATVKNQEEIIGRLDGQKETLDKHQQMLDDLKRARAKRYGYRIKNDEKSPYERVEYILDAVGMCPAKMNYETGTFDYGDWANVWFVKNNKPCMVNMDGSVAYDLNPNDYTKRATGEPSQVADPSAAMNAMSAIPQCWIKRYTDGNYRYVILCEIQYDEGYKAYAHTRTDGTLAPFIYAPIFKGYVDGEEKLRSLSGVSPMHDMTLKQEITAAKRNGPSWSITSWSLWSLLRDLLVLMGKSCNLKEIYGTGHTKDPDSKREFLKTGTLNNKGQFFGDNTSLNAMKVFHIENLWGDRWDRVMGILLQGDHYKVKMTPQGGYNLTGEGYRVIQRRVGGSTAGGIVSAHYSEYGRFSIWGGGSSIEYECDGLMPNPNSITGIHLSMGCSCIYPNYGAVSMRANTEDTTPTWDIGASLMLQDPK